MTQNPSARFLIAGACAGGREPPAIAQCGQRPTSAATSMCRPTSFGESEGRPPKSPDALVAENRRAFGG